MLNSSIESYHGSTHNPTNMTSASIVQLCYRSSSTTHTLMLVL